MAQGGLEVIGVNLDNQAETVTKTCGRLAHRQR
jgi:hypothetical protein